jgi:hypothetical protein
MLWAYRRRLWVLLVAVGLLPLWLMLGFQRFTLLTDRREMISPEANSRKQWLEFCKEFNYRNDFMVMVFDLGAAESDSPTPPIASSSLAPPLTEAQRAVRSLGRRVALDPHFDSVFYQVEAPVLSKSALYFLPLANLKQVARMFSESRPWLVKLAATNALGGLVEYVASQAPASLSKQMVPVLDLLHNVFDGLSRNIDSRGGEPYSSPFPYAQPDVEMLKNQVVTPGQSVFFYTLADGRTNVMLARPARNLNLPNLPNKADYTSSLTALRLLHGYVDEMQRYYRNTGFFITGEAEWETAEVHQALNDMLRCGSLGVVLLVLGVLARVRSPRAILCILVSNVIAACWLVGLDSLMGPLNILTVHHLVFAAMASLWWTCLVVLRFLFHLQDQRDAKMAYAYTARSWQRQADWFIAISLIFWLSMAAVGGGTLRELTRYCLVGFIVVALELALVVPALLGTLYDPCPEVLHGGKSVFHLPAEWVHRLLRFNRRRGLYRCLRVVFFLSLFGLLSISVDSNLLNLPANSMHLQQVESYLEPLGYSTLYAFSVAGSLEDAERRRKEFLAKPTVGRAECITEIIPRHMDEKKDYVSEIVRLARQLPDPKQAVPLNSGELLKLYASFQIAKVHMFDALALLTNGPNRASAAALKESVTELSGKLSLGNPGPVRAGMLAYQQALIADYANLLKLLKQQNTAVPNILAHLPNPVRLRTVSPSGKILIRIYPRKNSWGFSDLQKFVSDLRQVDTNVTGTPPLLLDFMLAIRNGVLRSMFLFLSVLTVCSLLFRKRSGMNMRQLSPARFAYPILGGIWCLGLAGLLGLELNGLNLWYLILSLHLGWLYSLATCASDAENCGEPVLLMLGALVMSALFLTASHEGVESCAQMMVLGTFCQLLASLTWPRAYWCPMTLACSCCREDDLSSEGTVEAVGDYPHD